MSQADAAIDIQFDSRGLVPVVAQDTGTGQVLMFAYASAEAISRTIETNLAHYYSRSRDELWRKGETSGHVQQVDEIRIDCDGDSVLYSVSQEGGACHTGYETCFYRAVEDASIGDEAEAHDPADDPTAGLTVETRVVADRVFDPDAVYE